MSVQYCSATAPGRSETGQRGEIAALLALFAMIFAGSDQLALTQ